ncbi:MAG: STAS/SEC14 domain-containing protein [Lewinellaceae bacterium]|nr:hypothetical protein [Phaeodactylibacter sp.]MCB0614234.1 hypothetical protein [Phaeodactylibacter sp.]MCB9346084.1 STAS/SEC14 domain-containing protein [Lewinellaceae bacterium]
MNMQSAKLELIKMIADIQSEELLDKIRQFLKETETSPLTPSLSREETGLLLKINEGLPEEVQLRYNELLAKLTSETITEPERQELLELPPRVEAKNAERLQYLVELAQLWSTTVDEAMDRLGIKPPPIIQ